MAPPRKPIRERLLTQHVDVDGCWIYTGAKDRDGYGVFGFGRGKQVRAHRASYREFVGPIPDGMLVCHTCDEPSCIRPEHLFVGSPKDNTSDMICKGRRAAQAGENHPMAKLTSAQVGEIRERRLAGEKLLDIASHYGVSFQYVSALAKRINRAHQ